MDYFTTKILIEDYNSASNGFIISLSDSGLASDRIQLFYNSASTDNPWMYSQSTEDGNNVSVQGTIDLSDGVIKNIRLLYEPDNYKVMVDGSIQATDTSAPNPPDNLTNIDVGKDQATGQHMKGVISNIRVYKKFTKK